MEAVWWTVHEGWSPVSTNGFSLSEPARVVASAPAPLTEACRTRAPGVCNVMQREATVACRGGWRCTAPGARASLAPACQAPHGLDALRDGALRRGRVVEHELQRLRAQRARQRACGSQRMRAAALVCAHDAAHKHVKTSCRGRASTLFCYGVVCTRARNDLPCHRGPTLISSQPSSFQGVPAERLHPLAAPVSMHPAFETFATEHFIHVLDSQTHPTLPLSSSCLPRHSMCSPSGTPQRQVVAAGGQ